VGLRNAARKWGHYDTKIPVYVLGYEISGRLTTASANGTYTLQIKSVDVTGGTGTGLPFLGELVNSADFSAVVSQLGLPFNFLTWWRDFNFDGSVTSADFSIIQPHQNHSCTAPLNP
jgi:hypothetical protein